jgi:hypothetical protein
MEKNDIGGPSMKRLYALLTGILLLTVCLTTFAQAESTPAPTEADQQGVTFLEIQGVLPDGSLSFTEVDPSDAPTIKEKTVTTFDADWIKGLAQGYDDPAAVLQDVMTGMFIISSLQGSGAAGEGMSIEQLRHWFSLVYMNYPIATDAWKSDKTGESGVS